MALTDRDRKMLYVLGAVAAVALLYLFVLKPGGGEEMIATTTGPTGSVPSPIVTPTVTPTPRQTLPPVILAGARDPFSIPPVFLTAVPSGSVSPPVSGSGTTSPPTTTPPTTAPPTSTPPPTTPPPTTPPPKPGDEIQIGGHDVVLQDVFDGQTRVRVEVDHRVWTVEVGANFDDNFKLVKIDGKCATFLFGDERFELCTKG